MVSPSPMPSAPISSPNWVVPGSICGRSVEWSLIASMSKNTAPGIWALRYSACASRLCVGKTEVPSTTARLESRKFSASQSVVRSQRLNFEAGGKLSFDMIDIGNLTRAAALGSLRQVQARHAHHGQFIHREPEYSAYARAIRGREVFSRAETAG